MPIDLVKALDDLARKRGYRPAHEILQESRRRRFWWVKQG